MALYNKIDKRELKAKLEQSTEARTTISFYQYYQLEDPNEFRDQLYALFQDLGVMGRVYVASEGINAQISVPTARMEEFRDALYAIHWLEGIRLNIAVDDDGKSFFKLAIKVRPKILADGLEDESFDVTNKGKHLNADQFNELTSREDSILIDMRNHYEHEVGHFKGAVRPDVDTFRDSLPIVEEILDEHREKNIVMYCTGGIRCEKASAWFKHRGFENVFQLEGGIIKYAQEIEKSGLENRFIGKNFVFDERLGERITEDVIAECHQCGAPCDTHTNCDNLMCNLLFIQCEECAAKMEGTCSKECQDVIHLSEEEQAELRRQHDSGVRIFTKGRMKARASDFRDKS